MRYFLFSLCLIFCIFSLSLAQDNENISKDNASVFGGKDIIYDVYYTLSNYDSSWVEGVKVLGTTKIGSLDFLIIKASSGGVGYVLLDSVRSVIPTGLRSRRLDDTNKR